MATCASAAAKHCKPEPRAVRIGNCSGFYGDRVEAMAEMLRAGELDVITGDYLAELTMLILGKDTLRDANLGYAKTFLQQLDSCLELAVESGVRIVANAGGLNPMGLAAKVRELAEQKNLQISVAAVDGDNVKDRIADLGVTDAMTANAYLGGFGIARALHEGADVVVTGRVTDASLTVGPAAWWHGWTASDLDAIAGAMAAGHVIECGTQATGGNYAYFLEGDIGDVCGTDAMLWPGYPIAEIAANGDSIITKHPATGGAVTVGTVSAQLLYEVAGPRYFGPDATLRLDSVTLQQVDKDRVRIAGCRGEAPPDQLKVAVTKVGGWRNEITFILTGLDIAAKADLFERQLRARLVPPPRDLEFRLARTDHADADTEAAATAQLTVVARDDQPEAVGKAFSAAAIELTLASYPGATPTAPPGKASVYGIYQAVFVPAEKIPHRVTLDDGKVIDIAPNSIAVSIDDLDFGREVDDQQTSTNVKDHAIEVCGETLRMPLGRIAAARSGDKGGDANIGVWVRSDAEWEWLRAGLSTARLRELLPETAELDINRYELPNLKALNFVVHGILGRGVAESYRFDPQAKGLGEWLRSREIDVPIEIVPEKYRDQSNTSVQPRENNRWSGSGETEHE